MSKYLEKFDTTFDDTIDSKKNFENRPYIAISEQTGDIIYSDIETISLNDSDNNEEILNKIINNSKLVNLEITRTFTSEMLGTLCLPFDIFDIDNSIFSGSSIYTFSHTEIINDNNINIHLKSVNYIKAGVPYFIQPPANITSPIYFTNIIIKDSIGKNIGDDLISFCGNINPTLLKKDDKSTWFLISNNQLYYPGVDGYMNGFRMYIKLHIQDLDNLNLHIIIPD